MAHQRKNNNRNSKHTHEQSLVLRRRYNRPLRSLSLATWESASLLDTRCYLRLVIILKEPRAAAVANVGDLTEPKHHHPMIYV